MPTYKSKDPISRTIYYDQVFKPNVEKKCNRYVNLSAYPFLEKISDEPIVTNHIPVLVNVSEPTISNPYDTVNGIADFYSTDHFKALMIFVKGSASVGSEVNISLLVGDTDNIEDFIVFREMKYVKKSISSELSLWQCDDCVIPNVDHNSFAFFIVAITSMNVDAPITITAKLPFL